VAVYDYGVKFSIMRALCDHGCDIRIFSAHTPPEELLAWEPHGIFLSNGPGDPEPVDYAVAAVRSLLGKKPIFGICLGHQILSLALGGRTTKLKFGHHGANHPVKYLPDQTLEGMRHKTLPAFSVQYHPEAAPGPHDSRYLFEQFIEDMKTFHA
jgi:carbamoyl-phosphate synthase small subunit